MSQYIIQNTDPADGRYFNENGHLLHPRQFWTYRLAEATVYPNQRAAEIVCASRFSRLTAGRNRPVKLEAAQRATNPIPTTTHAEPTGAPA